MTVKANNTPARQRRAGDPVPGAHARHVGRVGALAVALGIGAAVATTPGLAWAGPDSSSSDPGSTPNAASQPATAAGATAPGSTASTGPSPGSGPSGSASPASPAASATTSLPSQSTTTIGSGSTPTVTVSGSGGANTTVNGEKATGTTNANHTTNSPTSSKTASSSTPAPDAAPVTKGGSTHEAATASATSPADNVTAAVTAVTDVTRSVIQLATGASTHPLEAAGTPSPTARIQAHVIAAVAAPAADTTTVRIPQAAPNPPSTAVGAVSQLVAAVLSPFLNTSPETPTAPAAPALMWTTLAWVRRELDTATTQSATPAAQTLTSQTIAPLALAEPAASTRPAVPMALAAVPAVAAPPAPGLLGTVGFVVSSVTNLVGGLLGGLLGGLINQAPTAAPTIGSPDPITGAVTGNLNATDPNHDPLTYALTTPAANGTVTVTPTGAFTYTPTAQARAAALATPGPDVDKFTITISDGRGGVTTVKVNNVPIAPANRSPVASAPPTIGTPDPDTGVVTGNLNVTDPDGNALAYSVTTPPGMGTVTVDSSGVYTYTPDPQARLDAFASADSTAAVAPQARFAAAAATPAAAPNTDAFTVTASDGHGGTLAVAVNGVPIAPAEAAITATLPAGSTPEGIAISRDGTHVYVANTGSSTMSVIDTTNNTVATIATGPTHFVALSPDGTRLYAGTTSGTVVVVNTATNTVVKTIAIGDFPWHLTVSPDGSQVYVANDGADPNSKSVTVIDTATNTVSGTIGVGYGASDAVFSPDGTRAYITRFEGNDVTVVDTATHAVIATIPVGGPSAAAALNPSGTRLYTSTGAVIDTTTNTVIAQIDGASGTDVAFSPDGSRAYFAYSGGKVIVVDTATNTVVASVDDAKQPYNIVVAPDGTHAYVTNLTGANVSVISLAKPPSAAIDLHIVGDHVTASADSSKAFAITTDQTTGLSSLAIINTTTNAVTTVALNGGEFTEGGGLESPIAVSNDGTRAVVSVKDPTSGAYGITIVDTVAGTATTVATGSSARIYISPDDRYAYSVSRDHVTIIDTRTLATTTVPVYASVYNYATVRPDSTGIVMTGLSDSGPGSIISVVDNSGTIRSYDLPDLASFPGFPIVSSDGTHAYIISEASEPGRVPGLTEIDIAAGTTRFVPNVTNVAVSPDSSRVYLFGASSVTVEDNSGAVVEQTALPAQFGSFTVSSNGRYAYGDGLVIDRVAGTVTKPEALGASVGQAAASTNGRWVMETTYDQTAGKYVLDLVDTTDFSSTNVDLGHDADGFVAQMAFSADGHQAYAVTADANTEYHVFTIDTATKAQSSVALPPTLDYVDSDYVATPDGHAFYSVVWDPNTLVVSMIAVPLPPAGTSTTL
jgi:YVTN family beta-propeller protein/VCBS repeat-containing protein